VSETRGVASQSMRISHSDELIGLLASRVVGQAHALEHIVPSIQLHRSGVAPEGRPVGIFLLLGPTGTGKTRTVEALAEVLHGDARNVVKIDCGEFQSEHEVAKLIGAPPGYVGHAQTEPRLNQLVLDDAASPGCDLSLVLFDEIEKAAPSLSQLLLGVLDKATLRLGDGGEVNFENSLIFLTSNLGARDMVTELKPSLGFDTEPRRPGAELAAHLERVGLRAVQRHFSPEFVNRIDSVITYRPLGNESLVAILEQHVVELQRHVLSRLGNRSFDIEVAPAARFFMLEKGTSMEYGARELRRIIHLHLTQPLAAMVANGEVVPGAKVTVDLDEDGAHLTLVAIGGTPLPAVPPSTVLAIDDNDSVPGWLSRVLTDEGHRVLTGSTVEEALQQVEEEVPDVLILDHMLPDGDGVDLAVSLIKEFPDTRAVVMSGTALDEEEVLLCQRYDIPFLQKPFVAEELLGALEAIMLSSESIRSAAG
jgi:ATP-dependent Clp protease ATP-binding subunit ClpA/ActR/RegA family two-component response regulator